jgi:predicted Zn-dependent protease
VTPEDRLALLQRKITERPDDPFVRYGLAMSYRSLGRDAEAEGVFVELSRRCPDYVPTYLMLGQLLAGQGRTEEAARAFEAGVKAAEVKDDRHAREELLRALEAL